MEETANTSLLPLQQEQILINPGQYQQEQISTTPSMGEIATRWLDTKENRTGSKKTRTAYEKTLASFWHYLALHQCTPDGDTRQIARLMQEWSVTSASGDRPSTSTINQRLAIISSFYLYAMKQGTYASNPVEYVERPPRLIEHAAPHLETAFVQERLDAIDTSTQEGKRDKALLVLALTTGRRVSELANLQWKDVTVTGKSKLHIQVRWKCKGAKVLHDNLSQGTIKVLMSYLTNQYGPGLATIVPESPIFVSYSNNNRGGKLSVQALCNITEKHFGVTQFHATRHTFAVSMDKAGAKLSDIGDRLGHSNYKVTADYMKKLASADNKFADTLESLYGV